MNKRGFLLLSAYILIIAVVFLIASYAITQLWLHPKLSQAGAELQTAAYTPDLDYWFVNQVEQLSPEELADLYSENEDVRDSKVLSLSAPLGSFAMYGVGGEGLPSSYNQAGTGQPCPSNLDEENFMGLPRVVCDKIYYTRNDRDSFEDLEGYDPSFWNELDRELSTFDSRSFAFYKRDAYLQDKEGRIVKLEADVRLTK